MATNNYHQSSSSQHFHVHVRMACYWQPGICVCLWIGCILCLCLFLCTCVCVCVCLLCLAQPGLLSLSRCLCLSLNWRHKQQQLRNHPCQQEAGRCVNSPSTKLGCARLQKRVGSHISLFNHKHLHESGWKHTLGFGQRFAIALDARARRQMTLNPPKRNWALCLLAWEKTPLSGAL